MSKGRHVCEGLQSPSYEIFSRSSLGLSSARQRNTTGSADISGMANRSAIDGSAADMTGFHLYQPEEGHGDPNTSYQGQELNPSRIYNPMLGQSFSATEVSMPYMTDPLEGMLEYDPDFSFPTSLEDDNWNPEDLELGNRSSNSQEGVGPGSRSTLEDQEFESHLYSPKNQELGTNISTSKVPSRYRSKPNEIPAIHQHLEAPKGNTHSDAATKKISRGRPIAASSKKGLNDEASRHNIRFRPDGTMEWLDEQKWVKAVYHNDIRAELITETENLGVYSKFFSKLPSVDFANDVQYILGRMGHTHSILPASVLAKFHGALSEVTGLLCPTNFSSAWSAIIFQRQITKLKEWCTKIELFWTTKIVQSKTIVTSPKRWAQTWKHTSWRTSAVSIRE